MGLKLRLDKALTDLNGRPIMVKKSKDELKEELAKIEKAYRDEPGKLKNEQKEKPKAELERPLRVVDVCDNAMLSAEIKRDKEGKPLVPEQYEEIPEKEREARYILAVKMRQREDLKTEDVAKLKDLIGKAYRSSTLITGIMNVSILEGLPVRHGPVEPEGEKNE